MVGTISPVVYRSNGGTSWGRVIAVYSVAQILGAALMGLMLVGIGNALQVFWTWNSFSAVLSLVVFVGIAGLIDLQLVPFRFPSRNWQVPQSWKHLPPYIMAACYGFAIGTGVLTRIPFAGFYSILFAVVAAANLPVGVGIMVLYGVARAGTVALIAHGQAGVLERDKRMDTIASLSPLVRCLEGLALALIAGLLLGCTRVVWPI
jgi:hypothetical protein